MDTAIAYFTLAQHCMGKNQVDECLIQISVKIGIKIGIKIMCHTATPLD